MSEYHHLIGSDDVRAGGYAMERAAAEMNRAVGNMDEVLRNHQAFLRDWLAEYRMVTETGVLKPHDWNAP